MHAAISLLWLIPLVWAVPAPGRDDLPPPPPGAKPDFSAAKTFHNDRKLPQPAADYIPKKEETPEQFSEYLCVDDPGEFKCKWIASNGVIVDSATRPGPDYLQVAGTTALDSYYHQVGTEIVRDSVKNMNYDIYSTVAANGRLGLFTYADKTTCFPEYEQYADRPECSPDICTGACSNTCTGDGRKYDDLAGLGGVRATCLDDNYMCTASDPYYNQYSVLIHEWGHTVHGYGLDLQWTNAITEAYNNAYYYGIWDRNSYAMSNEFEYFAEATGTWFYVNFNGDSSGGMNRCGQATGYCASELDARWWLYEQDIQLYTVLLHVWNDYDSNQSGGLTVCP